MESDQGWNTMIQEALSISIVLEKVVAVLPFRQFLQCRLVSRLWDDAVRRTIPSRTRVDMSYCTMQKKAEDKKKSELEEKLDLIVYLRISHLQIGIEDSTPEVVLKSFEEIGPNLTQLTLKLNLEKEEDFSRLTSILDNSPNLQEFIWWGVVNEKHCHKFENLEAPSVKKLGLGFYDGEVENMGKRAMIWIASVFPNVESFTCLPHHREGFVRHLLAVWNDGTVAFPRLADLTLHLLLRDGEGLSPLLSLPSGLKILDLSLDGKRATGSVQPFEQNDATALSALLMKQSATLEKLSIRFLNLWKPKPLVQVELPGFPNLKEFVVTGDFSGDLSIDFHPALNKPFPKLVKLRLPYLGGPALDRFITNCESWKCNDLRLLDFKLKEKVSNAWLRNQSVDWIAGFISRCSECFPAAEILEISAVEMMLAARA